MKNTNISGMVEEENVLAGIVGAFLFSLAGGILWYVLYQVGFLAAISGIVGVICAIKGYSLFAKNESIKGIVISIIAAVVVLTIAWYLCLSTDVYNAYQEWYAAGEVDYAPTFWESVRSAYLFLEDSEIAFSYIKDLLIGLALCAFGAVRSITTAVKRVKITDQAFGEETVIATAQPENEVEIAE